MFYNKVVNPQVGDIVLLHPNFKVPYYSSYLENITYGIIVNVGKVNVRDF